MRVFVAGATGVIGARMLPLLVAAGHDVVGMTRSASKTAQIEAAGASAVTCDVFDAAALNGILAAVTPDVVVHQVTDLPDSHAVLPLKVPALNRARRTGTDHLVQAAQAANVPHFLAQSVAFHLPGIAQRAVDHLEEATLGIGGVAVRYGLFYGPGTWYDTAPKGDKVVHADEAARRTVELLDSPSGIVEVLDPT
ncbi:SDR family oxidoreductase [Demequina oxidasica]|uniref:SDR family oxidoreductase n=1 Tax=Demequina oxidasica TaxID=676199 RepID=UPI000783C7E3|nr:NAD-dependent epimerase/dehydratase family protein [Demequina oxidasica]